MFWEEKDNFFFLRALVSSIIFDGVWETSSFFGYRFLGMILVMVCEIDLLINWFLGEPIGLRELPSRVSQMAVQTDEGACALSRERWIHSNPKRADDSDKDSAVFPNGSFAGHCAGKTSGKSSQRRERQATGPLRPRHGIRRTAQGQEERHGARKRIPYQRCNMIPP